MDWIVIEGIPPYDGRLEFDLEQRELSTREWGWIKRLAGYLPLDLGDESKFGDPELIVAFAAIALRRAGKVEAHQVPQLFDRLSDAPFGATIRLETDTEAEAEVNPSPPNSNGSEPVSGPSSPTSSETSGSHPNPSGMPDLATSESGPPTSVT